MALDLSMSILVVDDSTTITLLIADMLRKIGFEDVDQAQGGVTALANMDIKRYGLVISDWHMEPLSGLDLLRQMRTNSKLSNIPFLIVTAESGEKRVIEAKEAGANHYIVKPFDVLTLKAKIDIVCAGDG
jgi:two-component system, chemotaxis family, chemotaxis protein CheY